MTIGQRVEAFRKAREWTQEELGRRIGSTGTYVGHIEAGRRNPGTAVCVALADAFGVSLDELVRGTSPKLATSGSTEDALAIAS